MAKKVAAPKVGGVEILPLLNTDCIDELDAEVFGAERVRILDSLIRRNPEFCFIAKRGSLVVGYLLARLGDEAIQLGPWIARDQAGAEALLQAFMCRAEGKPVFLDVPHPNAAGLEILERHGFRVQRSFMRMCLKENDYPGVPECVYGTSGAEKG